MIEANAFCIPEWIPLVGGYCFGERQEETEEEQLWQARLLESPGNQIKIQGSCRRVDYDTNCGGSPCASTGRVACDGTCVGSIIIPPTSWKPNPNTVCEGEDFTQTSNCETERIEIGTKTDGICCIATDWEPNSDTICEGENFTQTSNCETTQVSIGTMCCDISWTPATSTVCANEELTQTSNCGSTRVVTGTASESWTPATNTVCRGTNFLQTSNCGNTRQERGIKIDGVCYEKYKSKRCIDSYQTTDEFWWYDSNNQPSELIEVCPSTNRSSLTCADYTTLNGSYYGDLGIGDREGCCTPEGTSVNGRCVDWLYIGDPCFTDCSCMAGLCARNPSTCRYQEVGQYCYEDNDCRTDNCNQEGYNRVCR